MENYEDVESVQITPENYGFTPMGSVGIGGHINNEDHLTFHITFLTENNEVRRMQSIVKAPDFPDRKNENKEDE